MTCVLCNGKDPEGCSACGGRGRIRIEGCPKKTIPPIVEQAIDLCEYAEKGQFPIAGGVLDQSQCFLDVLDFVRGEEADHKRRISEHTRKP